MSEMPIKVKGYVVQNDEGGCLTEKYFWYEHDRSSGMWVHPEEALNDIRKMSETWDIKPTSKIPAEYSEETGTVILGETERF